jgi:hypothetical protein
MIHDDELRAELAGRGFARRIGEWSEAEHIYHYLGLIERCQAGPERRPLYPPHHLPAAGAADRPRVMAMHRRKKP